MPLYLTTVSLQKLMILSKLALTNPREFGKRVATGLSWRFEKPAIPKLTYVDENECLKGLTIALGADAFAIAREPALTEIVGVVREHVETLRKSSSLDVLNSADPLLARLCYIVTRCLKPNCVVETGVSFGVSSAFILKAMSVNNAGRLISIDCPQLGKDATRDTGAAIPDSLRSRWSLHLGRSSELLPGIFREVGQVDMFIHDSLHTEQNMRFELGAAWPVIRPGGALISDDIQGNCAFTDLGQRNDVAHSAHLCESDKKETFQASQERDARPSMGILIKKK